MEKKISGLLFNILIMLMGFGFISLCYAEDIYVAGAIGNVKDIYTEGINENEDNHVACYWKNNNRTDLDPGMALSLHVLNDDVYVAGVYKENACYWKNGKRYILQEDDSEKSIANSIYIYKKDVYIAGVCGGNSACYWKNGERYRLQQEGYSIANSIYVSRSNVYVAGAFEENACYWKNGKRHNLRVNSGAQEAVAKSIYVKGSQVYVAGFVNHGDWPTTACYWKNSKAKYIKGGDFRSIILSRNIVYVAGQQAGEYRQTPFYYNNRYIDLSFNWSNVRYLNLPFNWNNNRHVSLPCDDNDGYASSIFVYDKSIYIAGAYSDGDGENYQACVWVNGKKIDLKDGDSNSVSTSIFVVK